MPDDDFGTILHQARALPEPERARLVHDLLEALEGSPDTHVASAWEQEITRRLAQVESGDAKTVSRDELDRRLPGCTG